jgi:hypothetical protein
MTNDASHMLRGQPGNPGQFAGSIRSEGDADLGPAPAPTFATLDLDGASYLIHPAPPMGGAGAGQRPALNVSDPDGTVVGQYIFDTDADRDEALVDPQRLLAGRIRASRAAREISRMEGRVMLAREEAAEVFLRDLASRCGMSDEELDAAESITFISRTSKVTRQTENVVRAWAKGADTPGKEHPVTGSQLSGDDYFVLGRLEGSSFETGEQRETSYTTDRSLLNQRRMLAGR